LDISVRFKLVMKFGEFSGDVLTSTFVNGELRVGVAEVTTGVRFSLSLVFAELASFEYV
jgi:hypothetical protein